MVKIKVKTPVVEMDGDEMTRITNAFLDKLNDGLAKAMK